MLSGNRLSRLERMIQEHGLNSCSMCRRRLAGKVPVQVTPIAEGEALPPPDYCPECGVEWPMLVMCTPDGPFQAMSPLPYDPANNVG